MKLWRQGDVAIVAVKSIPKGERKARRNGHILEGETTGHIHRVREGDLAEAELFEVGEQMFLSVTSEGVSIVHEEHDAIVLPAGNYQVLRQSEYAPEEIRNVAD